MADECFAECGVEFVAIDIAAQTNLDEERHWQCHTVVSQHELFKGSGFERERLVCPVFTQ